VVLGPLTTISSELVGMIQCVVADEIRPAIEYLEGAARVTDGELRRRFHRG
jgi:hypothetical protein